MTETSTAATSPIVERSLHEAACDLIVIEHRLRDLRRWTPATAHVHLDAALTSVATALDALHAEYSPGGATETE